MYESIEKFSLRKINYVKTRTIILRTTESLLKQKPFSEVTVDEICQKAQISRGTFFNYFSSKEHIFYYFVRIFTIAIALKLEQLPVSTSFRMKMDKLYEWFTQEEHYDHFINHYIHFILSVGEASNEMKLIDAEFVYYFKEIDEASYEYYNNLTLNKLFEKVGGEAKAKGEISVDEEGESIGSLMIGEIVGSYISDHLDSTNIHLDNFHKIWS